MSSNEVIKGFLRKKSSYLNWGNRGIQGALSKKFNGRIFDLEDIKKAKKELKKEFKDHLRGSIVEVEGIGSGNDEAINELSRIANKLGFQLVSDKVDVLAEKSVLKRKKPLKAFHVPELSDQTGMHLMMACHHAPFHNTRLHRGILELIKDYKHLIKGFHLMGDFLDLNPLSSHDKGRFTVVRGLTLDDEYAVGNELLDDFDMHLPKGCWKTYLYGNHEDRYNRWMAVMDNAKTPLDSPEDALKLWKRGYNVKTNWSQDFITIGKNFDIFHGIYFNIHNAKKHLDTFGRNCAYGHTHRVQMYREGNLAAHNIGTCANLKSKVFGYATRAMKESWSNGFSIDTVDAEGLSHLTQIVPDETGGFWFAGKYY
tara:strand:- start:1568 stop:2674 length:1107 start_codon:yes stop_codon:yes gene_type:complete